MAIKIACSEKETVDDVVDELVSLFGSNNMKLLIYFASKKFPPAKLSAKMQSAFLEIPLFGCSTAGEMVSGKMLRDSVVAMAFDEDSILDAKVEVVEKLSKKVDLSEAISSFERHFGETFYEMNPSSYLGIILVDGLCGLEERLMDVIGDRTNVLFAGGSAADDLEYEAAYVYANGRAYTNAAVLTLIKPATQIEIVKTQSVREMGPVLVVTKANEDRREIIELNNKPAVKAYAEALGVPINELASNFPDHPLGLVIDGEPYIRSPTHISGDSVIFRCSSVEGMPLSLLEVTNVIEDTKLALLRSKEKLGGISGIIIFNCLHRILELKHNNLVDEYTKLFDDFPTIGFNSLAEQFIGNLNQTAVMILFK